MEVADHEIAALAKALAKHFRQNADPLWGNREIAAHVGYTERQVANRVTNIPGFPKAIRLPVYEGQKIKGWGHPRYISSEVIAFLEKYKG